MSTILEKIAAIESEVSHGGYVRNFYHIKQYHKLNW